MADVGVTNMGGLRTALPEGDITYGNIYEITPFENTLCIVTMNGVLLRELFENIAAVHGEGLSGACLEILEMENYWMLQWPEKKLKIQRV